MRVINHSKYIKHVEEISLNIGGNEVDEKAWEKATQHPIVKGWIENGDVEVEQGDLEDITKITPGSKAIAIIETTFSQEKLQKWQETEKRKAVLEAINKQIEYLNQQNDKEE
ncbi:hypothetical protein [Anaerosolibacter sp.]|uniref:hypothetical protein n=1 Tax=Anaerosolibacter sp. TaxID=1872527 RepID=UPI0039EEDB96